jgi:hypothetical protein
MPLLMFSPLFRIRLLRLCDISPVMLISASPRFSMPAQCCLFTFCSRHAPDNVKPRGEHAACDKGVGGVKWVINSYTKQSTLKVGILPHR